MKARFLSFEGTSWPELKIKVKLLARAENKDQTAGETTRGYKNSPTV
jgi:hypothetical protein